MIDWQHVLEWGQDGLRTLVFAYREIPGDEFAVWYDQYRKAMANVTEKVKHDAHKYPNAIDDAMDTMECNLVLLVRWSGGVCVCVCLCVFVCVCVCVKLHVLTCV